MVHACRASVLLLPLLGLLISSPASPASIEDVEGKDICMQFRNARMVRDLHQGAALLQTSVAAPETVWLGHKPGHGGNYWQIGAGPARPFSNANGMWTFDDPVHGDSLQGWWPIRVQHTNASGAVLTDEQRPWWATPTGNVANYVINQRRDLNDPSAPGNRTFGVIGVWHRDPGNTITATIPGTNPTTPGWTPLAGSYSAWMGIRGHGDLTVPDPVTGNYINASIVERTSSGETAPGRLNRRLPGYMGHMDQMMYRDIDLTGAPPATGVTLKFTYRTNMSTGKDTNPSFRTGWHEGDPLSQNQATPGNFISAEAGTPANAQAPIDSFQVYIGAPVDDAAWLTSLGDTRSVYDPHRRWFNEVLQRDDRRWLFGAAGDHATGQAVVNLSAADRDAFLTAAAAAGHPGRLRVVFRVHTNRAFDDALGSLSGQYHSGYAGAAIVDDVIVDSGSGDVVIGDFEAPGSIDNALAVDPADAWKSTGKPADSNTHVHDVATLVYQDICGPVGGANRTCDLRGAVVSLGLHEFNEAAAHPDPLSTDRNGFWGMVSPTISLVAPGSSTPNGWDVTGDMVAQLDDIVLGYDIYTGFFDTFTTGQLWQVGFESYPGTQSDGAKGWGGLVPPGCLFFNPEKQCFRDVADAYGNSLVATSNPSGIPDSIRFVFMKLSECYRFGVTTGCASPDGGYLDNLSIGLVRAGSAVHLQADIWDLFNDAFPANETPGLPGTAAFDTAAAHIKIGLNVAPTTGNLFRYNVPGDSMTVQASGDSMRLDLLFRIRPGVGNHMTVGHTASGLRQVPTSTTQATPGDGSFWGSYMVDPGAFSGPPGSLNPAAAAALHAATPGGWSSIVWNSARMDTTDGVGGHATFPVQNIGIQQPPTGAQWCSNYHETELSGARAALGVPRNRCFVIDTTVTNLLNPNVHCGAAAKGVYPPAWVTTLPASRTGWDGTTTTVEGTKIIPDGQLTPGAHVQYFVRRQDFEEPASLFSMLPDTNVVYPQVGEANLDGHRWQQFAVLPDRWKDNSFGLGGVGLACMLFIDVSDRRGEERIWKGIADTLGFTSVFHMGNADGYGAVPSTGSVNDPQYFFSGKNQQMGTFFDMYQVKGGEALLTSAASLGSRLGYRAPGFLMDDGAGNGKWSYTGPTPDMLDTYYRIIVLSTGDLNSQVLRPFTDATSDDITLLQTWLASGSTAGWDRAILTIGDGFVESAYNQGGAAAGFVGNYLGATLVSPDYKYFAPTLEYVLDLPTSPPFNYSGNIYGLDNLCTEEMDVLGVNVGLPNVSAVNHYESIASGNVAAIFKNFDVTNPWAALTTGFSLERVRSRRGGHVGRLAWSFDALMQAYGALGCAVHGPPQGLDLPSIPSGEVFVDFAGLRNNPVRSGYAAIAFGLAQDDRVEIAVFDVSGRRVRTLAERMFKAGEHELIWDGLDDGGHRAPRGVYFTRVRYQGSGFEQAAKLTILK